MSITQFLWLCGGLVASLNWANGAKILMLNSARIGQSHMYFMGKIADVLHDAGHNVTFYQQEAMDNVKDHGVRKAKVIVRHKNVKDQLYQLHENNFWKESTLFDALEVIENFTRTQAVVCKSQLKDRAYLNEIRSQHFEIAIVEWVDFCALGMLEAVGVKKFILASALMQPKALQTFFGLPISLGITPAWEEYFSTEPTYLERILSVFRFCVEHSLFNVRMMGPTLNLIKTYVRPDFNLNEKLAQASYVFMNVDEHLAIQMPTTAKFIFLGGSYGTIAKAKELDEDKKDSFIEAFKQFPQINFIWKYEKDDGIAGNVTNVFPRRWIPQNQLLGNKNVIGFITHGGLNSVSEAAEKAVPTICIPMFADQNTNCQAAQYHGISVLLRKESVTTKSLVKALRTILEDGRYVKNARKMSALIRNKPFTATERIVKYVEHALKHDVVDVLDLPERKLGFIKKYNIYFILFFSAFLFALLYVTYKLMSVLCALTMYYFICFAWKSSEKIKED